MPSEILNNIPPQENMVSQEEIPQQTPIEPQNIPLNPNNLALSLDKEILATIGNLVVQNYETDMTSRDKWAKNAANYFKLFAGYREMKNTPWSNCSNVHVPLLGVSSLQFQARAYDSLIQGNQIASCIATDGKSVDVAARTMKYLNYQLTEEMDEWEEDMDTMLLALPIFGSAVKKTYYSHLLGRPVSRFLNVDEFVAPYRCRRLEDASRKTHMYFLSLNDVKIKVKRGDFTPEAMELPSEQLKINEMMPDFNNIVDKITGQTESTQVLPDVRFILEQHLLYDLDNDGLQEPYIVIVDYKTRQVLSIQQRWVKDKWDPKIDNPIEMFTAYTFIPNPVSWMGFGFGHLMEGLNESANTLINQLIDSGTLANVGGKSGLISKRSGIKKKDVDIQIGKFSEVDIAVDDIRKAIYTYDFREPSMTLFNLLGLLKTYSQEVSSVSDTLLGKLPPSDTTATSMLAVMEQGMKVFSVIHKRLHRGLRRELQKIFYINSIYLNEQVYYTVQDSASREMVTFRSGRSDFNSNIDVRPISDPTISSRAEKLIKAKSLYDMAIQNPLIANDKESLYEVTYQLLTANEVKNINTVLKKPEPPPPPPNLTPQEEHAQFLSEMPVDPLPEQDSFAHLDAHFIFRDSNWGAQLSPQGKKLLEDHIMKTKSLAYLQEQQLNSEMKGMGGGNDRGTNKGGMEGMDNQPSNSDAITGTPSSQEWVDVGLPKIM